MPSAALDWFALVYLVGGALVVSALILIWDHRVTAKFLREGKDAK